MKLPAVFVVALFCLVPVARAQNPDQVTASQKLAVAQYPDLGKEGTPMQAMFVAEYQKLKGMGAPQLRSGRWPEELAKQCADRLGVGASSVAPAKKESIKQDSAFTQENPNGGGLLLKPGKYSVNKVATNPFSLQGAVVELVLPTNGKDVKMQEVEKDVYEFIFWGFENGAQAVRTRVDKSVVLRVAATGSLFVEVTQGSSGVYTDVKTLGNSMYFQGLSRTPSFGWK